LRGNALLFTDEEGELGVQALELKVVLLDEFPFSQLEKEKEKERKKEKNDLKIWTQSFSIGMRIERRDGSEGRMRG
jgi:hypothetical protein